MLMNNVNYHYIIHQNLERTHYKMSVSEKIKATDNKFEKNKDKYNLDRQTAIVVFSKNG